MRSPTIPKAISGSGLKATRSLQSSTEKPSQVVRWQDVLFTLLSQGDVSLPDHAGYLGRELYKAELAIRYGRSFEQDGEF